MFEEERIWDKWCIRKTRGSLEVQGQNKDQKKKKLLIARERGMKKSQKQKKKQLFESSDSGTEKEENSERNRKKKSRQQRTKDLNCFTPYMANMKRECSDEENII